MYRKRRMYRLMDNKTHRSVFVPIDHGVTLGPINGLADLSHTLEQIVSGRPNAIVSHLGLFEQYGSLLSGTPYIAHLSAGTELGDKATKQLVGNVQRAVKLGADAVSIHVNLGVENESLMLRDFGLIAEECREWGMPLLAMVYPNKINKESVTHAARIAAELGADFVKVPYPGSREAMETVVAGCWIPILVAGGPVVDNNQTLTMVQDAILAGAKGVALGRNAFQQRDIKNYLEAVTGLIHQRYTLNEAFLKSQHRLIEIKMSNLHNSAEGEL